MAERPQPLVREAVVVALLLLLREPNAAQLVGRIVGRDLNAIVPVDDFTISRTAPVRDPRARTGAHDRLEGRDESARRTLDHDGVVLPNMDVGLAVGNDDHILTAKLPIENSSQGVGRPGKLFFVAQPMLRLDVSV